MKGEERASYRGGLLSQCFCGAGGGWAAPPLVGVIVGPESFITIPAGTNRNHETTYMYDKVLIHLTSTLTQHHQ